MRKERLWQTRHPMVTGGCVRIVARCSPGVTGQSFQNTLSPALFLTYVLARVNIQEILGQTEEFSGTGKTTPILRNAHRVLVSWNEGELEAWYEGNDQEVSSAFVKAITDFERTLFPKRASPVFSHCGPVLRVTEDCNWAVGWVDMDGNVQRQLWRDETTAKASYNAFLQVALSVNAEHLSKMMKPVQPGEKIL